MYAEIVHVQCYRGWYVETGFTNTIFGKLKIQNTPFLRAHNYLRHIGFARWFQRIESLFGGNWVNGASVSDKCPCHFSNGRECSISIYGVWWGETCPHWHVCGSLCVSGTMLRQSQVTNRISWEHAECFLSSLLTFLSVTCLTFPLWTWEIHGNVRLR